MALGLGSPAPLYELLQGPKFPAFGAPALAQGIIGEHGEGVCLQEQTGCTHLSRSHHIHRHLVARLPSYTEPGM